MGIACTLARKGSTVFVLDSNRFLYYLLSCCKHSFYLLDSVITVVRGQNEALSDIPVPWDHDGFVFGCCGPG